MPGELTELTELTTALGMLVYDDPIEAIAARPAELVNVGDAQWERLAATISTGAHESSLQSAWRNGRAFLLARDGLRGRLPVRIEWKGPQHLTGYDTLPADLRIDHVYLISCKYMSKILMNPSPPHLFDRALAVREGAEQVDWYEETARAEYHALYREVRELIGGGLPPKPAALTRAQRDFIGESIPGRWPEPLVAPATAFSLAVGVASAERWRRRLTSARDQEQMLWRILRLNSAPYFVLGASQSRTLRLRIGTPWDWRQLFRLRTFEVAGRGSGQPCVDWVALVEHREARQSVAVRGHVEVRWSHGKFCGAPEAKVYLDSPHDQVPGYFELT